MSKVIDIHFTSSDTLRLTGRHVPSFFDNYFNAVKEGSIGFTTEGDQRIFINTREVCFIDEYEEDDKPQEDKE